MKCPFEPVKIAEDTYTLKDCEKEKCEYYDAEADKCRREYDDDFQRN